MPPSLSLVGLPECIHLCVNVIYILPVLPVLPVCAQFDLSVCAVPGVSVAFCRVASLYCRHRVVFLLHTSCLTTTTTTNIPITHSHNYTLTQLHNYTLTLTLTLTLTHSHTYTHSHTHTLTHTHTHTHTLTPSHPHTHNIHNIHNIHTRLSPEFYDNIIRLPIPISSGVLIMIGVLPMHPSPHVLFRSLVVGRWNRGLGCVAYIVPLPGGVVVYMAIINWFVGVVW